MTPHGRVKKPAGMARDGRPASSHPLVPQTEERARAARRQGSLDRNCAAIYPYPLCCVETVLVPGATKVLHPVVMKTKQVRAGLDKRALVVRLRKIKGQLEGLERMVDSDADTPDILMQVVSARQALKSFSQEVIEAHMHECIESAASQAEGKREIRALLQVLKRYAA